MISINAGQVVISHRNKSGFRRVRASQKLPTPLPELNTMQPPAGGRQKSADPGAAKIQ
jgi:hypothetical protein